MIDFNPANIQAMAAGARYGYEVPAAAPTTTTPTNTGGALSGADKAGIINTALGAAVSIVDSIKGLWGGNSGSGSSTTLQDQNLASLGSNNKSNTWVWVVGGMAVVALVVFFVLRKKK